MAPLTTETWSETRLGRCIRLTTLSAFQALGPGRRYAVTVVRAGLTHNGWLLPAEVLEAAVALFEGAPCLLDHAAPQAFPSLRNLAGTIEGPTWNEAAQSVEAILRVQDSPAGDLLARLFDAWLEDRARGITVPPLGLSATLSVRWRRRSPTEGESAVPVCAAVTRVWSVDAVLYPAAGGQVERWVEPAAEDTSITKGETVKMSEQAVEIGSERVQLAQLEERVAALDERVSRLTELLAAREEAHTVQGMAALAPSTGTSPASSAVLRPGLSGLEQVAAALDALIAGTRPPHGIPPLAGLRELYNLLSGDYELTGVFQPERVYLANVTSSTLAGLVANALNKAIVNEFQQYPKWWEPIVVEQDFGSLQQVRWITLGGVGELPTVAEGAAYTELTWDDLTQVATFVKKGGYLGLTIEAIDKDDVGRLRAAPRALAQAAWYTLGQLVSEVFTANNGTGPQIYYDDAHTRPLFHSANGNLGSSALSWAAWNATRQAMRRQPEHHSGAPLGALTAPKYLLVPAELEVTALQILASESAPDADTSAVNPWAQGLGLDARLQNARNRVIVVDLWSDPKSWAAVADPRLWPTIGIGYRYGRTPEVFSVASPTAGLMFTNDTMPTKVRFVVAVGPMDYRGLYKHNVA